MQRLGRRSKKKFKQNKTLMKSESLQKKTSGQRFGTRRKTRFVETTLGSSSFTPHGAGTAGN